MECPCFLRGGAEKYACGAADSVVLMLMVVPSLGDVLCLFCWVCADKATILIEGEVQAQNVSDCQKSAPASAALITYMPQLAIVCGTRGLIAYIQLSLHFCTHVRMLCFARLVILVKTTPMLQLHTNTNEICRMSTVHLRIGIFYKGKTHTSDCSSHPKPLPSLLSVYVSETFRHIQIQTLYQKNTCNNWKNKIEKIGRLYYFLFFFFFFFFWEQL